LPIAAFHIEIQVADKNILLILTYFRHGRSFTRLELFETGVEDLSQLFNHLVFFLSRIQLPQQGLELSIDLFQIIVKHRLIEF